MSREPPHYFGAGPALLPESVVKQASQDLITYLSNDVGVCEISHRSADAIDIINTAKARLAQAYSIPDTHEILFAQGGGTGAFAAVAYNLTAAYAKKTGKKGTANYLVTGSWSEKAAAEAKRLGFTTHIAANSKQSAGKYGSIPDSATWQFTNDISYVYYCDNETVNGVEFPADISANLPQGVDIVADMSSNILSREIDISKFAAIVAGAQKNIGVAGITVYIVRKDLLSRLPHEEEVALGLPIPPIVFDWPTLAKNNSTYNTLPIFGVHVLSLCVKSVLDKGGLKAQQEESESKADKVYQVIDKYPQVFNAPVAKDARSIMNIVFTLPSPELEKKFLDGAKELRLNGIKGHRSVGGIRISNYNAVTPQSIDILVTYMESFAKII
ncbi:uncharacterized protein SAPINGB_P002439 [Magnusiomyces paraingens]|uniref:phosphoserine transaminase n=1 Tax=Magnusiomyces paraingens TaxID=2606893 RepID=A0A5E8BE67_9ASCO|nr:uncharacterized protein SAPINGB_P002439 [Saprochaete ingens]VVT49779.1 unnamed protein product [Saprochaete ingens]